MKHVRSACLAVLLILTLRSSIVPIHAQETGLPPTYFSETGADGITQLRALEATGQARNVFSTNNEGIFDSISPDGSTIAFIRLDGPTTTDANEVLWLGKLQTGRQSSVGNPGIKSVASLWSPDSHYILIWEAQAGTPLWAGYNWGQLSVYDAVTNSKTVLTGVTALAIGWYSDSQSILLWNDTSGYFRYFLSDGSAQTIEILDLPDRKHLDWSALSPSSPYLAIISSSDGAINVYDARTGGLLKRINKAAFGDRYPTELTWSPQGTYLAVRLDDGNVAIWDYASNTQSSQITNPITDLTYALHWTLDGQYASLLFEGPSGTTIYYAPPQTGQLSRVYETSANTPTPTNTHTFRYANPYPNIDPSVNTTDDTDDGACNTIHCSPREALQYASLGDVVTFACQ